MCRAFGVAWRRRQRCWNRFPTSSTILRSSGVYRSCWLFCLPVITTCGQEAAGSFDGTTKFVPNWSSHRGPLPPLVFQHHREARSSREGHAGLARRVEGLRGRDPRSVQGLKGVTLRLSSPGETDQHPNSRRPFGVLLGELVSQPRPRRVATSFPGDAR